MKVGFDKFSKFTFHTFCPGANLHVEGRKSAPGITPTQLGWAFGGKVKTAQLPWLLKPD